MATTRRTPTVAATTSVLVRTTTSATAANTSILATTRSVLIQPAETAPGANIVSGRMAFTVNDEAAFSDDPAMLEALGNGVAGALGLADAGCVTVMLDVDEGSPNAVTGRRLLVGTVIIDFAIDAREADPAALQSQLSSMNTQVLAAALNGALAAAGSQARISAVTAVDFDDEFAGRRPHLRRLASIVQDVFFWLLNLVVVLSIVFWGHKVYSCGVVEGRLADAWQASRLVPYRFQGHEDMVYSERGDYRETRQDSKDSESFHSNQRSRELQNITVGDITHFADASMGLDSQDDESDDEFDKSTTTSFADARSDSHRNKIKHKTVDEENRRKERTAANRDVRLDAADGDWLMAEVIVLMAMPFVGCGTRLLASLVLNPAVIFGLFLIFCLPLVVRAKAAEDFLCQSVRSHEEYNHGDLAHWRYWMSCVIWTNGAWYGLSLGDAIYWDGKVVQEHFVSSWRATGSVASVMWCVETLHIWGLMLIFLLAGTVTCLGYACANISGKPTVVAQIAGFDDLVLCMRAGVQQYELLREDADRAVAVGISRIIFEGLPRMALQTSLIMAHGRGPLAMPCTLISVLVALAGIVLTLMEMIRLVLDRTPPSELDSERGLPGKMKAILGAIAAVSLLGVCVIVARIVMTEVCPEHSWGFSTGCNHFHESGS